MGQANDSLGNMEAVSERCAKQQAAQQELAHTMQSVAGMAQEIKQATTSVGAQAGRLHEEAKRTEYAVAQFLV